MRIRIFFDDLSDFSVVLELKLISPLGEVGARHKYVKNLNWFADFQKANKIQCYKKLLLSYQCVGTVNILTIEKLFKIDINRKKLDYRILNIF